MKVKQQLFFIDKQKFKIGKVNVFKSNNKLGKAKALRIRRLYSQCIIYESYIEEKEWTNQHYL